MIWQNFQRPAQVTIDSETQTDTYARFVAQPFERGWGTTVGNALRRALLSSITGASITAVKIEGVEHEFSAVPGVVEDATDLMLNLKKVPLVLHGTEPVFLTLDAKGSGEVKAGQFAGGHNVEITDPDVHIATLSSDGHLHMVVRVAQGRSYVPAEQNQTEDLDTGFIPLDSAHSPVRKANFRVEMARLGQMTNYERLVIEVWTNGTVTPQEALSQAARLIQGHMAIYAQIGEEIAPAEVVDDLKALGEEESILDREIETLDLSIRSLNCLKNADIKTLRDLVSRTEANMTEIRNFGEKSLKEVREKLEALGLGFGMKLDL
ncbi:MAG: DNA-directed RNA polymerase subunit alpha [Acidobacteria bacterium]|nr:DNA-directed RNA polymerase subunit alpha [Acidobacteriota bacterium]